MRAGNYIYQDIEGKIEIGIITSGGYSPTLRQPISMGRIKNMNLENIENVYVRIRDNILPAKICKLPFIQTKYKN